jgi:hypothetical protein
MAKKIDSIAKKLSATVVGNVPDFSAGAFGISSLAKTLRDQLEPSRGKRLGRPSNRRWTKRSKVPMAIETEARLKRLAKMLSDDDRQVTAMQVAAHLLEESTATYFVHPSRAKLHRQTA